MLVASFVSVLLTLLPIAIDSSVPYASSSRLIVATVIAVAAPERLASPRGSREASFTGRASVAARST